MKTRALLVALFLLTTCSCYDPKPWHKPTATTLPADVALTTGNNYDAEVSAAVIPPNGKCGNGTHLPSGRIISVSGGAFRLLVRDLVGGGGQKILGMTDGAVFGDLNQQKKQLVGNDNQLVRLNNGDLLLVWNGISWEDITDASGNPAHPAWWDYTPEPGTRGAFHIWRSADCGDTWTYDAMIDTAKVKVADETVDPEHKNDAGRCAWPQGGPDANGKYWRAMWDREEVYADPFDGRVYISATCNSGSATHTVIKPNCQVKNPDGSCSMETTDEPLFPGLEYKKSVVLASKEAAGKDWSDPVLLKPPPNRGVPAPMTSTGAGRLFVYQSQGDQPTLRRLLKPEGSYDSVAAHSITDPKNPAAAKGLKDCYALPGNRLPASDPNWQADFLVGDPLILVENTSISRVREDQTARIVRFAYPAIEDYVEENGKIKGGRQVFMVTVVITASDGGMFAFSTTPIRAEDPKGSVLQATFVETDRTELDADEDAALLYWVEEVPGDIPGGKLIVRGKVVRDAFDWSDTFKLSGAWTPSFDPGHNGWRGDYLHGAFYFADGKLNFLAQWPQTDETLVNGEGKVTPNLNIHYNVVTVDPLPPPNFVQKIFGGLWPHRYLSGSEPRLQPPAPVRETNEVPHQFQLELLERSRRGEPAPAPTPRTPLTAPKVSTPEFYYGGAGCGRTEAAVYVGVLTENVRAVELHYVLQADGYETPEVVRTMSRTERDPRVYSHTISATGEELPAGYERAPDARLLYYVVVTDARGVSTRGETYGSQPDSAVRLARCGR